MTATLWQTPALPKHYVLLVDAGADVGAWLVPVTPASPAALEHRQPYRGNYELAPVPVRVAKFYGMTEFPYLATHPGPLCPSGCGATTHEHRRSNGCPRTRCPDAPPFRYGLVAGRKVVLATWCQGEGCTCDAKVVA